MCYETKNLCDLIYCDICFKLCWSGMEATISPRYACTNVWPCWFSLFNVYLTPSTLFEFIFFSFSFLFFKPLEYPGGPVVSTQRSHCPGAHVHSLVWELRSASHEARPKSNNHNKIKFKPINFPLNINFLHFAPL